MSPNTLCRRLCQLAILALLLTASRPASALGTGIAYTGQLLAGSSTVTSGSYDLQFTLYNAATGGTQVGSTLTKTSVPVAGGVFYVELDFGSVFTGTTLYLQTAYRVHPSSGSPAYTTQSPRKLFTTSANADYAAVSGSTKALQGFPVSAIAPTDGQVLTWTASGDKWLPQTPLVPPAYTAGTGLSLSGTTFSVATGGITNTLLGAGSVGPSKITSGAISGDKLALPLTASVSSSSDLFTLTNTGGGRAIVGNSASNTAVKGVGHNGVYGQGTNYGVQASGTNYGVYSTSSSGIGVYGQSTSSYGIQGLYGATSGVTGNGTSAVLGDTNKGNGVIGLTSASNGIGVLGATDSNGEIGVYGLTANTNGVGVQGSGGYDGVIGYGTGVGVLGNGSIYGVLGDGTGSSGSGIYGDGNTGVTGSGGQYGVYAIGGSDGVYALGTGNGSNGIYAQDKTESGYAVWGVGDETGTKANNFAGYFTGNVYVGGTLSKSGGSFKIDDPIDPANKYLYHSFVESPDMMNIYNGNITTDANGDATVTMPKWFGALNQDFRYQLTVIGQFAQAIIATEIEKNHFTIKTDKPGVKVSWQVTGIRHDAWANAHRIPVEENKPEDEQDLYLHPKEFGLPESQGINFQREQAISQHHPKLPVSANTTAPPLP